MHRLIEKRIVIEADVPPPTCARNVSPILGLQPCTHATPGRRQARRVRSRARPRSHDATRVSHHYSYSAWAVVSSRPGPVETWSIPWSCQLLIPDMAIAWDYSAVCRSFLCQTRPKVVSKLQRLFSVTATALYQAAPAIGHCSPAVNLCWPALEFPITTSAKAASLGASSDTLGKEAAWFRSDNDRCTAAPVSCVVCDYMRNRNQCPEQLGQGRRLADICYRCILRLE